jgi:hypothetical protein
LEARNDVGGNAGPGGTVRGGARLRPDHFRVGAVAGDRLLELIISILLLLAGVGVLIGNQMARWFAVAMLGINAIEQMFFIPAYPFWSLTIIAMDMVALYGLCAYGSRANVEAVT